MPDFEDQVLGMYGEKEDVNEAHDPEMTLLLTVFGLRLLFNARSGVCG